MSLSNVAEWVSSLKVDDIPEHVMKHVNLTILDTISVMIRGCNHTEMQPLIEQISNNYPGNSVVLGQKATALPEWAAFLNATGGSFLELDEGQRPTGHPGIHVIPSTLAFSSHHKKSGREFLLSVICGYEIQSRISSASQLRWEIHPHGNMGTTGAAVAIGKLLKRNEKQIQELISIATTLSLASSWTPCYEGATVRNTYAGVSALTANLANHLVDARFTGVDNALADVYGQGILGKYFDLETFTENLGSSYSIENNYFKFHACCALNHSPLDAVARIIKKEALNIDQIEKILVEGNKGNIRIAHLPLKNRELAYKFSLPFAIATFLYHKHTNLEAFTHDLYENREIRALADKITVIENEDYTNAWPKEAKSKVSVQTKDQIYESECPNPIGTSANKASVDDIYQKSKYLVESFIIDMDKYLFLFEKLHEYESMDLWIKDLQQLYRREEKC